MRVIPRLRIHSYFSEPTDLAAEMRGWPEFVSGSGYDVELTNKTEEVRIEMRGDAESGEFILILGSTPGELFDRVAGCAIRSLSAHTDYLMVYQCSEEPTPSLQPTPTA